MTNETKLLQHIDQLRARLNQIDTSERSLVEELADSLKMIDQQLLHDVRNASAEHQNRRGTILNELQALADSMGMFRLQHEGDAAQPVGIPQTVARPKPAVAIPQPVATTRLAAAPGPTAVPEQIDYGHQYSPNAGDWRQATRNLSLQEELELHLNGLNGKGPRN